MKIMIITFHILLHFLDKVNNQIDFSYFFFIKFLIFSIIDTISEILLKNYDVTSTVEIINIKVTSPLNENQYNDITITNDKDITDVLSITNIPLPFENVSSITINFSYNPNSDISEGSGPKINLNGCFTPTTGTTPGTTTGPLCQSSVMNALDKVNVFLILVC